MGSMVLRNQSFVNVAGPNVTLTLRNAPAKDALMAITQMGGYGFVYVDDVVSGSAVTQAGSGNSSGLITGVPPGSPSPGAMPSGRMVTMAFRNESYSKALNSVLLASGLQGKREGNMILVGANVLGKSFGSQISKVYRLNQASAPAAADYLASLGASITKVNTITNSVTTGTPQADQVAGGPSAQQTQTQKITTTDTYGGGMGPLRGLIGTTDSRLQTITLIGDAGQVAVAENYLRQLDLRQRQVALSVKILDVNLSNVSEIDNSFAFRYGNNFIVNDQGRLLAAFGRNLPATRDNFNETRATVRNSSLGSSSDSQSSSSSGSNSSSGRGSSTGSTASTEASDSVDDGYALTDTLNTEELNSINQVITKSNGTLVYQNPDTGQYELLAIPQNNGSTLVTESTANSVSKIISAITGRTITASRTNSSLDSRASSSEASSGSSEASAAGSSSRSNRSNNKNSTYPSKTRPNPGLNYPDSEFFDFLQAQIVSSSTKILASPTLILQEGEADYGGSDGTRISSDGKVGRAKANEGFVRVGTQFVTSYEVKQDVNGNNFCQPVFGNAGLTFGAKVDKIDDNGFVTFSISPEISAAVGQQQVGNCGAITLINDRLLDTGKVRVRDGQTLILTGVISDDDRTVVSKWPILGDLPLVGQFFRRTSGDRRKGELVIMVTPRIINDDQGALYGYGYQPATQEARRFVYPSP